MPRFHIGFCTDLTFDITSLCIWQHVRIRTDYASSALQGKVSVGIAADSFVK